MAMWAPDFWLSAMGRGVVPAGSPAASTSTDAAAETSTDWVATLVGPAVVAAFVTVVLGGLIASISRRGQERRAALLELRLTSLNEFYAPIKTLLSGNKVLRDAVRAEFGIPEEDKNWHMLDHLDEVKADPRARKIVAEVLQINLKIGEILETKSGLDLGQSTSAGDWEVHRRLLARAFGEDAGSVRGKLTYFPKEFEEDIVKMHEQLIDDVKSSVGIKR